VNRIEDLMDPSFLMDWKILLEENNHGKRSHPYKTPNAFITFLAELHAVHNIPFRSLEGIARIFARITGIRTVSYTSIFRRIRKIAPQLPPPSPDTRESLWNLLHIVHNLQDHHRG
jgi:hypothetical protein